MDIIDGDLVGSLTTAIVAELQPGEDTHGIRLRPGAFTALCSACPRTSSSTSACRSPTWSALGHCSSWRAMPSRPTRSVPPRSTPPTSESSRRTLATALASSTVASLAATGHSPKRLSRIGRMQSLLAAGRGESWARTAAEFGYHDESHMINDVQRLASATPQAMLAGLPR